MAHDVTTTPLGANGVFTGISRKSDTSDTVNVLVFSDQSGSLEVQQSIDGNNWDFKTTHAVTGGTGLGFSDTLYAPYWRIRYVNGATPQTAFRLAASTGAAGRN